ncbi:MAG: GH32 C-terminal domain-containing protein, partial [Lachnospiraceae bacterium]|nr:GH32 C-terminal domain-containing protein [Lachnospiraceae bacterium]
VVSQRAMKIKKIEKTLKLRMLFDRFSVELFVNDGAQVFSATYYTPLDAEDIIFTCDGTVVVNVEKYEIQLDVGERN